MIDGVISNEVMEKYANEKALDMELLDSYPDYLSLEQMREFLGGIGKRQAFALLLSGEIESDLVGRTRIIKKSSLLEYAERFFISDELKQQVEIVLHMHYEKLFAGYADVVSTETLEKMLNASNNYVLPRLVDGRIKSLFIGRTYRIPKQCIIDFAASREHQKNKRRFTQLV